MRVYFISGYAASVLLLGIFRGESSIRTFLNLKKSEATLAKTVLEIKHENKLLALEIEKIQKSPSYALRVLRDRYHMTGDQESMVLFSDNEQ